MTRSSFMRSYRAAAAALIVVCCAGFAPQYGGPHDFDFEAGVWRAHIERIAHPLSGDSTWLRYDGLSVVHPLLHGRENVGELEVSGPAGSIDGITIRTYDPQSHQWSVRWVNAKVGQLTPPLIGGFAHGIGTFYGNDTLNGKPIVARFIFSDLTRDRFRLVQAFSSDGGRSWESNWIATFTRVAASPSP